MRGVSQRVIDGGPWRPETIVDADLDRVEVLLDVEAAGTRAKLLLVTLIESVLAVEAVVIIFGPSPTSSLVNAHSSPDADSPSGAKSVLPEIAADSAAAALRVQQKLHVDGLRIGLRPTCRAHRPRRPCRKAGLVPRIAHPARDAREVVGPGREQLSGRCSCPRRMDRWRRRSKFIQEKSPPSPITQWLAN